MKFWKPLLLILPASLLGGFIAAKLVQPSTTIAGSATDVASANDWRSSGAQPTEEDDYWAEDTRRIAQQDRYRPNFDWEEEYRPAEREGIYSYYDDLDRGGGPGTDVRARDNYADDYAPTGDRAAAERAGQAAERAADEAELAAEVAAPAPPAVRQTRVAPIAPAPAREPRTADGDLPAIW